LSGIQNLNINFMKNLLIALAFGLWSIGSLYASDQPSLDSHLERLQPLLGKTWKGAFVNAKQEKPTVDVMKWERILNGKAVRILHSINDGVYGGETIIRWDNEKQAVTYFYFSTAGFMTTGTMEFRDGKVITRELVAGSSEGITEVRGESELRADGSFHVKTEYLKKGEWVPGHEVNYKEDAGAVLVFR
jgi:hypothetical protein